MKKINKFLAILIAVLGVQVASAQTTIISNGDNLNKQCNFGSVSSHTIPEIWTDDKRQGFNLSQSVELPNGVYTLSFQMMYRASLDPGISTNCALYAETSGEVYNTPIKNFGDESGVAESLSGVTSAMNEGKYLNTIPYFVVTDGKATVGARSLGALTYCTNGYWTIFNPASFKLVSVVDDATLTTALNDVKAEAKAILDAATSSDAKNTLQAVYDAATATNDDIVALKKAIKAYLPNTGTAANPVDVSSLILSADFSQKAFIVATKNNNSGVTVPELQPVGWSCADGGSGQYNFFNVVDNNTTYDGQSNFAYNGKTTGQTLYMRNAWSDNVTISAKQTVTLPNGRYKISIPAKKSGNTATIKYTFAGETETHDLTTSWNVYEKVFTVNDVNNTLTIELSYFHSTGGGQRAFFDGVTLLCYGDPIAALLTEIASKKNELETFNGNIPSSLYGSFNAHHTSAGSANNTQTEAELQEIIDNLSADIVKASNALIPYKNLKSLISLCTEYTDTKNSNANSETILTNFQTAISTATTSGDAALNVDEINTAYNNLESARQTYARNAVPVYPYPFDMTFLIGNATFDSNIDGWTKSGGAGWMNAGNVECYNNTFTFSKSLEDLGSGSWEVSVDGFYRYGGYNDAEAAHNGGTEVLYVKFYANANEVALMSIMEGAGKAGDVGATTAGGVRVPNGPAEGNIYFAAGCYKNTVATIVTDGNLNIGLKKETTQGSDWTLFDNFKLVYKGIDVSELQASLTALIAKAEGVKSSVMGKAEETNLTSALNAADATVTVADDLNEMISNLQSAYDAAVISIDTYSKVPAYIAKANNIDASIAEIYQTNYDNRTLVSDAETIRQELEVATYNYVKDNFTYDVALSDTWNSTGTNTKAATFSNEHWSGETREYMNQDDSNGQGWNANSWSIDFNQEVALPAGEYVFKVAGRKSADATLELNVTKGETVLGTVNDFPSSNNALGINKAGAASFDAADPAGFANDGKGRGWQWRYVKFTLAEESTVKVAIHAETDKIHNWVSFGNYTLQMTDETYMAAGQPELDAALTAAEALVGTKPMGTDEETALKEAIDLPVTTGAEQKAKVNALNTAVENIKTWRATYYAEKDKLVAALERFETDYNDAENGSLEYMNNSRWTTVIEKAQAAAVAKDNQTSHADLTTATNELTEALNAATVSVNEYAALKSAIDEANTLVAANVGDLPFERPQSAADAISTTEEQALYDAATADGEGVTSVTDALTEGIATFNNTPLNAPKDGARYNLVLNNNNGWTYDGNAVTYLANDRVDAGLYNIQYLTAPNANYAQAFTLTAVEGKQDCYYISMTDVEGNERYVCTGVVYDGNTSQLRTTTKAEDALAVKVIATTIEGVHNLYNTEANDYIGGQDAGFFTVNSHINFNIREAAKAEVAMNISAAKWSTLILPFNAALPEGVKAYSCNEADVETETLTLTEATTLKANTPYLINGEEDTHEFSGYGLAKQDTYAAGIFTGTYVDYQTTANSGTYVLQKHDNVLAFYLVGESAKPWVRAYRCYITLDNASTARMFSFGFDNETTGIDNAQLSTGDSELIIFDIMGRKVTSMKKGNLYIINGKKVLVK